MAGTFKKVTWTNRSAIGRITIWGIVALAVIGGIFYLNNGQVTIPATSGPEVAHNATPAKTAPNLVISPAQAAALANQIGDGVVEGVKPTIESVVARQEQDEQVLAGLQQKVIDKNGDLQKKLQALAQSLSQDAIKAQIQDGLKPTNDRLGKVEKDLDALKAAQAGF